MTIIRAISETSGNSRDVICDESGKLIVTGVSLDGDVSIDLSATNALLTDISETLNPPGGAPFEVQIPSSFPITLDTGETPLNVVVDNLNLTNFPDGLPVRIESADDTINLSVEVTAISETAFPNGIPIEITGIDETLFPDGIPIKVESFNTTEFPDGIPIKVEAFNTTTFPDGIPIKIEAFDTVAFPDGIPINVTGISTIDFPDGIPINITTQSAPLQVKIDTTSGPSVVTLDATQFSQLLDSVTIEGEVVLSNPTGQIDDSNPLSVSIPFSEYIRIGNNTAEFGPTNPLWTNSVAHNLAGPIDSSNPLDVTDNNVLGTTIADADNGAGDFYNARITLNAAKYDSRTIGDNTVSSSNRFMLIGMPGYTGTDSGTTPGTGDITSWGHKYSNAHGLEATALQTLSTAVAYPEQTKLPADASAKFLDSEVFYNEGLNREPSLRPLAQSDRGDLFVGYHKHTYYNNRAKPVNPVLISPSRGIARANTIGRILTDPIRVGALDGTVVMFVSLRSVMSGTTPLVAVGLEWNPLRDELESGFDQYWSYVFPDFGAAASISSPTSNNLFTVVDNSSPNTVLRVPILGRYCRAVCWFGSEDVTSCLLALHLDVHKGPY